MSEELRPDPDALLAAIASPASGEGQLKIFLGMCPGVGKTYAMLLAGQTRQEEGVEVVIGVLETHGRVETTAVAAGLPRIPLKPITHRGVTLAEMDLDAILARRPQLALVDELAHSNAVTSRHPKRWQDVMELLKAGIDVYTTLNIQHIESQRDVVRQITGAPVHETVPDSVIDRADEIELIDLTPEQLRKRLDEGKVYLGDRAAAAAANFFREGNLRALREIALRLTAEKADRDLRAYLRARRIAGPFRSRERFLVAVGASPFSGQLIRLARRAASTVHGTWIAVHIDTGQPLDPAGTARLEAHLALARSLGAEVILTSGTNIADAILRVAAENNVTQILVGKPLGHPLWELLTGRSLVNRLIRRSGDIDITVVRAEKSGHRWRPDFAALRRPSFWRELGLGTLAVLATTLLGVLLLPAIGYSTVGLIYLLTILLCATALSQAAILATAALSALVWNFLFIPPIFTFRIGGADDVVLFVMYFVVALVTGQLHARLRLRERAERRREEQTRALYQFSRALTEPAGLPATMAAAAASLRAIFAADVAICLPAADGRLSGEPIAGPALNERERAVAEWVLARGEPAGRFTHTLPQSPGFHLPLRTADATTGVLVLFVPANRSLRLEERQMLETFAAQLAVAVERHRLHESAARAEVEERSRQLQKSLLDSVSHELRTPLAVIAASAQRLSTSAPDEEGLLDEILTATRRLARVVNNLLSLTRLESGSVQPRPEWCDLTDIVDQAVTAVRPDAPDRAFPITIAPDAATLRVDAGLLEETLRNLIRNAAQHTPVGTPVEITARRHGDTVTLTVSDHGPGIPPSRRDAVFAKFVRGPDARPGGLGMGLALARGFVEALGGTLTLAARPDGAAGSTFTVTLPASPAPAHEISPPSGD